MNKTALAHPVIVIGMHRSGTTLLCQCLEKLGVFMGARKDENEEAFFFFRLNEWMFRQLDASWDNPSSMKFIDSEMIDHFTRVAWKRIKSPFFLEFTGVNIIPKSPSQRVFHDYAWG